MLGLPSLEASHTSGNSLINSSPISRVDSLESYHASSKEGSVVVVVVVVTVG